MSNTVWLWDPTTRHEIAALRGHTAWVISLAFSPDGKTLASGSNDATVKLWDLATKQVVQTLRGHTSPADSLAFSPDGKTLVTGSGDSMVKLWNTATWEEAGTLRGHTAPVTSLAFSPDGETLVSGSWDGTLKVWDIALQPKSDLLTGHNGHIHSLAFSPDGKTLASGGSDHTVRLWDLVSGRQATTLTGHEGELTCVAFSPDGQTLASCGPDKNVRLWDVATRREQARFAHRYGAYKIAFSVDGKTLATNDGVTVRLWDIATRREKSAAPLSGYMHSFSPDGKTLALGGTEGAIWLRELSTRQAVATFTGHVAMPGAGPRGAHGQPRIVALAFSPDGQMLASADHDRTVRLWNLATGQEDACLRGHTDSIWTLAFAPDGKTLATCSRDGTVKLWNLTVRTEAATLNGHQGQVCAVAFAPDGDLLATAGTDGKIRLWRASPFSETDAPGHRWAENPLEVNPKEKGLVKAQLGMAWIHQGSLKQAAADFSQALDLLPPGTADWHLASYWLAFVLAYLGRVQEYQALCQRTVRDYQQTSNVQLAERTAKMCFFADLAQDPETLLQAGKLADFAIAKIDEALARMEAHESLQPYAQHTKGIVEYRRGNYAEALDWCQKSLPGLSKNENGSCQATNLFFSAMAAHRLGKIEDAHKWLAEAQLTATAARADDADWLIMDLVRREAEALIEGKER
jgi:WD40 repeat protein